MLRLLELALQTVVSPMQVGGIKPESSRRAARALAAELPPQAPDSPLDPHSQFRSLRSAWNFPFRPPHLSSPFIPIPQIPYF